MNKINVNGIEISVISNNGKDQISLTDMIRNLDNSNVIISNWMRQKNTLEYLALWEKMYNPEFKLIEFDELTKEAGLNRFTMSPKKWIEVTGAIGINSKAGKNGGTYAHKDIAFHFGLWLSPEFNLLLIKEFQKLKDEEQKRLNSDWDYRRFLSKANYVVHTDAIKRYVIPLINDEEKKKWAYAGEADLLNIALFGFTAAQWRNANPDLAKLNKNPRDLADAHELLVLSNLEGLNAILNQNGISKENKLELLRKAASQNLDALRASSYTIEQIQSPFKKLQLKQETYFGNTLSSTDKPPKDDTSSEDEKK